MSSELIKPPKNEQFEKIVEQFEENKDSMIQNVPYTKTRTQKFLKHLENPQKSTKGGRKKSLRKTNRKRKTRRRRTNRRR